MSTIRLKLYPPSSRLNQPEWLWLAWTMTSLQSLRPGVHSSGADKPIVIGKALYEYSEQPQAWNQVDSLLMPSSISILQRFNGFINRFEG